MQITHKMHRVRHLVLKEAFFFRVLQRAETGGLSISRSAVAVQCSAVQCSAVQ